MSIRRQWKYFDFILLILVCGFAAFGILMVGAAASYASRLGLAASYSSQKMFFVTGLGILAVFAVVDYHFVARFHWIIYALMILLLLVVMVTGSDDATNTARWIRIGDRFAIQPSEFSKIFIIIFLAEFIDKRQDSINNIRVLVMLAGLVAAPTALILIQPALSACLVIAFISVCVIFSSDLKSRYIIIALLIVIPVAIVFAWDLGNERRVILGKVLGGYQLGRIDTFLNPDKNSDEYYQTNASLGAISSGMMTGKGYKNGSYVPYGMNDFIFAVVAEQFGFAGCAATLIAIFVVISKCILIASRAPDGLGRLLAMGVAGKLAFEVIVNVCVATDTLPNTGVPFPFLSSGGSSMWVNMACIGLVINVGLFRAKSIFKG